MDPTPPMTVRVTNSLSSESFTITLNAGRAERLRKLLWKELGPTLNHGLPDCHRSILVALDVQQIITADLNAMASKAERTLDEFCGSDFDDDEHAAAAAAVDALAMFCQQSGQWDDGISERVRCMCCGEGDYWPYMLQPMIILGRIFGLRCNDPVNNFQKITEKLNSVTASEWGFRCAAAVELLQRLGGKPGKLHMELPTNMPRGFEGLAEGAQATCILLSLQVGLIQGHYFRPWAQLLHSMTNISAFFRRTSNLAENGDLRIIRYLFGVNSWPWDQSFALLAEQLERCQQLGAEFWPRHEQFQGCQQLMPTASVITPYTDRLAEEQRDLNEAISSSMKEAGACHVGHSRRVRKWRIVGCQAGTMTALAKSNHLQTAVTAVESAGCEVMPAFGNGALMLVPTTEQQVRQDGWAPKFFEVLLRDEDLGRLKKALDDLPRDGPGRGKPVLRAEENEPIGTT